MSVSPVTSKPAFAIQPKPPQFGQGQLPVPKHPPTTPPVLYTHPQKKAWPIVAGVSLVVNLVLGSFGALLWHQNKQQEDAISNLQDTSGELVSEYGTLRQWVVDEQGNLLEALQGLDLPEGTTFVLPESAAGRISPKTIAQRLPTNVQVTAFSTRDTFTGSGVLLTDSKGETYVLTNNHVIEGGSRLGIEMADGTHTGAALVAATVDPDLALLRLPDTIKTPATLQANDFRSSTLNPLQVGESTFLIGNPIELHDTVTAGIVSHLDRPLGFEDTPQTAPFIQTDAPCSPGNSGGALYDSAGKVIGILTAYDDEGQDLCFAIPIDTVSSWLPEQGFE